MNDAETEYRNAVRALEDAQNRLSKIPKGDPSRVAEREEAKQAFECAAARVRQGKENVKRETTRKNFAGLQSPFHEVVAARFPEALPELEAAALALLAERERVNAEKRAAKKAAATPEVVEPPEQPATRAKVMTQAEMAEVPVFHRRQNGAMP